MKKESKLGSIPVGNSQTKGQKHNRQKKRTSLELGHGYRRKMRLERLADAGLQSY